MTLAVSKFFILFSVISGNYEGEGLVRTLDANSEVCKRDAQPEEELEILIQVLVEGERMNQSEQTGRPFAVLEVICGDIGLLRLTRTCP